MYIVVTASSTWRSIATNKKSPCSGTSDRYPDGPHVWTDVILIPTAFSVDIIPKKPARNWVQGLSPTPDGSLLPWLGAPPMTLSLACGLVQGKVARARDLLLPHTTTASWLFETALEMFYKGWPPNYTCAVFHRLPSTPPVILVRITIRDWIRLSKRQTNPDVNDVHRRVSQRRD